MKRIEKLKKRLFESDFLTKKEWWGENETILNDPEVIKKPIIIRKALAINHVARNMPIELREDELIVGKPTMASIGFGRCFPTYTLPEEDARAKEHGLSYRNVFGHHPPSYEKILSKGLVGVREDIAFYRAAHSNDPDAKEKNDFYDALLISLDALEELQNRYVDLIRDAIGKCKDAVRKAELLEIYKVCQRVPKYPASSFHEALQSVWLAFSLFHSTMELIPLGRSDQYLYPYYKNDIDTGKIDKEFAEDLVGSWLVKFNERVHQNPGDWELHATDKDGQYNGVRPGTEAIYGAAENDESYNYGTSANHWLINMILGGLNEDGTDATNELSYILLEQWAYLEAVVPVMSVRIHDSTPSDFKKLCCTILRNGASEPALYNDNIIIDGLTKMGIPLEDARGYSNDGCWEPLIPGKTNFGFCMLHVLQLLEYILQGGRSLVRNRIEKEGIVPLDSFGNYESFYRYFIKLLEENAVEEVSVRLMNIRERAIIAPSPLLSAFMDNSVERGLEYSVGGAKYNLFGLTLTGLSNCVDSLAAIRKLVFEERAYTLKEVADATKTNFEGNEIMRQRMLNGVPKFGNDNDYVDSICVRLMADFAEIISRLRVRFSNENILLAPGVATFEYFVKWGHDIGASADGRTAQSPVASNYSPSHGMDVDGPTATIRSITMPDLIPYTIGAPLDIEINPNEMTGDSGLKRMESLIQTYMDLGGNILTITGTSREKLIAAQKEPEKYRNLRVRLGGFSAYFISLSKEVQNSIIGRTSHEL